MITPKCIQNDSKMAPKSTLGPPRNGYPKKVSLFYLILLAKVPQGEPKGSQWSPQIVKNRYKT